MRASGKLRIVLGLAVVALVSGCQGSSSAPGEASSSQPQAGIASTNLDDPGVRSALDAIKGDLIKQHMSTLADDKLEGRGLGTAGYDQALAYVENTLTSYGVEPAGENGGFRQRVPLRNSSVIESASFPKVTSTAGTRTLAYGVDYLPGPDQLRERATSMTPRRRLSATASARRRSAATTTRPPAAWPAKGWCT